MKRKTLFSVTILSLALLCLSQSAVAQSNYTLKSPNQKIEVKILIADRIAYDVLLNGKSLLQNSTLSIDINHQALGLNPKVKDVKRSSVNREIEPVVRQKFARVLENYNELRIEMNGNYAVDFRAFKCWPIVLLITCVNRKSWSFSDPFPPFGMRRK